jgi:hypothetical protein
MIRNLVPLLFFAVLAATGCATEPAGTAAAQAPRRVVEIICEAPAQAGGATSVVVRNGIAHRISARVLWPNGLISRVVVQPETTHVLMDLPPEKLPCQHPLKLLDWSPA